MALVGAIRLRARGTFRAGVRLLCSAPPVEESPKTRLARNLKIAEPALCTGQLTAHFTASCALPSETLVEREQFFNCADRVSNLAPVGRWPQCGLWTEYPKDPTRALPPPTKIMSYRRDGKALAR